MAASAGAVFQIPRSAIKIVLRTRWRCDRTAQYETGLRLTLGAAATTMQFDQTAIAPDDAVSPAT